MKHGNNQLKVVQSHQWTNDAFTDTLMSYLNLAIRDRRYTVSQDDAGANKVKVLLVYAFTSSNSTDVDLVPQSIASRTSHAFLQKGSDKEDTAKMA